MKLLDQLNGNALFWISRLVQKSGRFRVHGLSNLETAQKSGKSLIFTAWHGMTMMLVGFFASHYDLRRVVLLMPDDWRGAALEVFARKVGAEPFPMNLEEKGMGTARKLASLVKKVKTGRDCYITPDGPDGPAFVAKPGVSYIAQKTEALIVPLGAFARPAYRQYRWDQYAIPWPLSRVSIQIGKPFEVGPGMELTAVSAHLTHVLHQVAAQAVANHFI